MLRLVVVSLLVAACLGARLPKQAVKPRVVFPSGRIVGGKPIDIAQAPHQVALEDRDFKGFQFCGGSLISKTEVLTAGHCTEGEKAGNLQIRTGSSKHESGGTTINVKKIINNPNYNSNTIDHDAAILVLEEAIPNNANSQPISLVEEGGEPLAGDTATVTGWGTTSSGGGTPSQLQSVDVPIVDREECAADYDGINEITARMICAGVKGKDSCQGDSGGPLVANGKLVGIVSWGVGCAQAGYPGVYGNVGDKAIRKFIKDSTGL